MTQKRFSTGLSKARSSAIAIGAVLALVLSHQLHAQNNTSYSANTNLISGTFNCAFGVGALSAPLASSSGNIGIGYNSLFSLTNGYENTAVGLRTLYNNTSGSYNVAIGARALQLNTTGFYNTATGFLSLHSNDNGANNTATGYKALQANTSGSDNTAIGADALKTSTTSNYNTAIGSKALSMNTFGYENTAIGFNTLAANTYGHNNIAIGSTALPANTYGYQNIGIGLLTLENNTTGYANTVVGSQAMRKNTNGYFNTASGIFALFENTSGTNNTGQGYYALANNTTGSYNTNIGAWTSVSTNNLSNATALGANTIVNASNKVRIGNTSVTVIEGQVAFTNVSDGRFKTNVKEEDVKGLEFIRKLRPVVYNFDTKKLTELWTKNMPDSIRRSYLDKDFTASTSIRQSGFIAQEVEQAAKEVNYNFNGVHTPQNENDNYSLAYAQFVVPLVKAVQEQQKMIEDLQQQIHELQKGKGTTTGISNDGLSALGASMEQNIPNPFSQETIIRFNLPQQINSAYMTVYDLSGREIKTLPIRERGAASITLSADQLEAGMYIYSIVADGKMVDSKRMVVSGK